MEQEWQLPPETDRMQVNAALTVLTERYDANAAHDVILAFQSLPANRQWRIRARYTVWEDSNMSGETPQHGSVRIQNTERTTHQLGGQRELSVRVGSFKVFRIQEPNCHPSIWFHSFWASDPATVVESRPDEFTLAYLEDRLVPIRLMRLQWQRRGDDSPWLRLKLAIRLRTLRALCAPIQHAELVSTETLYFDENCSQ